MVHYNDMLEDLDGEMRRIAEFVGIAVDESIWPSLVRAANFQKMRQAGSILMPQHHANFKGGADQFFHKGTIGGWRDTLTVDDLALYDAKVREKFTPGLAAWIACGRLVAGDPRESAS
jgi:aryl sulfotransferase